MTTTAIGELEARLAEALAQQTATSEILRVICASPTDVQPVLDAVAERAAHLCKAPFARVLLVDGDLMRASAEYASDGGAALAAAPVLLRRTSISGRAVLDRDTIHHADIVPLLDSEFPLARENARRAGFRAVLAVPLIGEGGAYGAIVVWRREPGLFSPSEVALVQTFARQASIAIDNVRLFNETRESLEQQTATAQILQAISKSPGDIKPVLDTVVRAAAQFCGATNVLILRLIDGSLRGAAAVGPFAEVLAHGAGSIEAIDVPVNRDSVSGRAAFERRTFHIHDLAGEREDEFPLGREMQRQFGHRTILATPLLREGVPLGVIVLFRTEVKPFSDKQLALIQIFADQAAIALENVRLFNELGARNRDLSEALEQQTATSEVLKVISRSAFDLQPVFDTVAENGVRLCEAERAFVYRFDGKFLRMAASHNASPELKEFLLQNPIAPGRHSTSARAALERKTVHVHDVRADPEKTYGLNIEPIGTMLGVPMLKGAELVGVILIYRLEVKPFTDKQIALIETFADQAVIAIENVRLFTELEARNRDLTEALEQQTATSEILRVISQSQTNVQPVFDAIAAAALKLCAASSANVFTFDGELIHLASFVNVSPAYVDALKDFYPKPPGRGTASLRAVLTRSVVAIADVLEDKDYSPTIERHSIAGGFRSILAVPLLREGNPIGAIAIGRPEPGPFPDNLIALLKTFADQAVIAIENVRLFTELDTRTTQLMRSVEQLKALDEVGQAVSSTLDLETVLNTIVSKASQLADMDGAIYEYDETRELFHLHATNGFPDELVEALRTQPIRKGEGAIGRLAVTGEPVQIRDIVDERGYQSHVREILIRLGYRSLLAVPLLREDHLLGGLSVNRKSAGEFAPQVIELLQTYATQSALAIQNARLFREIEVKSRQLETASRHKSEFLANMSHELRTPLNAIIGFSEVLSERMFGEINDKQAEYLSDILESGRHLLSLINDILDLSKIEAGRMELEPSEFDLPGAIDNAMILVRERAQRHGIALGREVDARLGTIRADERKVKQVLLNLLSNALKFTPEGGRIDVRAGLNNGTAEISVSDTGVGIAAEDQATVFEEFRQVGMAAKKIEGTGLGLAISRKFIELHGGTIAVKSQLGTGSTFTFTLPL
jgi:GAF domain-containing protein